MRYAFPAQDDFDYHEYVVLFESALSVIVGSALICGMPFLHKAISIIMNMLFCLKVHCLLACLPFFVVQVLIDIFKSRVLFSLGIAFVPCKRTNMCSLLRYEPYKRKYIFLVVT